MQPCKEKHDSMDWTSKTIPPQLKLKSCRFFGQEGKKKIILSDSPECLNEFPMGHPLKATRLPESSSPLNPTSGPTPRIAHFKDQEQRSAAVLFASLATWACVGWNYDFPGFRKKLGKTKKTLFFGILATASLRINLSGMMRNGNL